MKKVCGGDKRLPQPQLELLGALDLQLPRQLYAIKY